MQESLFTFEPLPTFKDKVGFANPKPEEESKGSYFQLRIIIQFLQTKKQPTRKIQKINPKAGKQSSSDSKRASSNSFLNCLVSSSSR